MTTMRELYDDLNALVSDAFYHKDFVSKGSGTYRIFSYRLASAADFEERNALESRGIMFEIDADTKEPIRIASRTMKKFFNAGETQELQFKKDVPFSTIKCVMPKLDGSVIATFMDNDGIIRTKSNSSLESEHAYYSTEMIHANDKLHDAIICAEAAGYTVIMEFTSPEYRIILPYQKDELTVLRIIHRESGESIMGSDLKEKFPVLYEFSVFGDKDIHESFPVCSTLVQSIAAVREMEEIEGYVVVLQDGTTFKLKTDWYCNLHFTKDSIIIDSRLFKAVLDGSSDDLRQLFENDEYALKKVEKMENLIFLCYNKLEEDVTTFYEKYKHLDQKTYAMKVLGELSKDMNRQGLAFNLYNGKPVDYKEVLLKYMKNVLEGF